ncbi:NUDIX domain-containing protein [Chromobacterium paludis]|uniref:NUDIX domain-containing protein n=1 Tax=Chromobacterium paludis TaxID=2605945 RepID=A0A5C1DP34_9NEIS|nr:NUDIX domain-containing protein [Chromobacterium paludis]QEL57688.1 NUDIX domain-containing protein [Chromobacterium paludis]
MDGMDPASSVLILLSDGQRCAWQRRARDDDSHPGCLDFAAGGGIEPGESPRQAALRELEEELGVSGLDLQPLGEMTLDGECCALFQGRLPDSWRLGPEVDALLILALEEISAWPREGLHPQLAEWLGKGSLSGA